MEEYLGTGKLLHIASEHPCINQPFLKREKVEGRILDSVNKGGTYREKAVETTYYLTYNQKIKRTKTRRK